MYIKQGLQCHYLFVTQKSEQIFALTLKKKKSYFSLQEHDIQKRVFAKFFLDKHNKLRGLEVLLLIKWMVLQIKKKHNGICKLYNMQILLYDFVLSIFECYSQNLL